MGMVEYLAQGYYGFADGMCYATGLLIVFVLIMIWKKGGLKKPKKKDKDNEM